MKKAKVVMLEYSPAKKVVFLKNEFNPYPYLTPQMGFKVDEESDEGWVTLRRREEVYMDSEVEPKGRCTGHPITQQVRDLYSVESVTQEVFDRFEEDVLKNALEIFYDEEKHKIIIR